MGGAYRRGTKTSSGSPRNQTLSNILTINVLVQAGLADVSMDVQGNPVGLRLKLAPGAETVTLGDSVAVLLQPPVPGEGGEPPMAHDTRA